jgi:hypothetical protein
MALSEAKYPRMVPWVKYNKPNMVKRRILFWDVMIVLSLNEKSSG